MFEGVEATPGNQGLDLAGLGEIADRVLELVRQWAPGDAGPPARDWNDLLLITAFTRAYRCMCSIRELAGRGEADDAAILTRALLALTLRYVWLARVDDEDERNDRRRRLTLRWASDRATLGEELEDLGYFEAGTAAPFRATAEQLERECVRRMPDDAAIAKRLDRELGLEEPRFLELVYARIYRTTSDVAHYGIGAALEGFAALPSAADLGVLPLHHPDEERAAEALGLALVTYGVFLELSEPIVQHGLADQVAELIREHHLGPAGEDGPAGARRAPAA
jgi:Family of unknown function (DUF5677)